MDFNKPVSGREFARLVGVSEGAVRKAKAGFFFTKGVTENGKFVPAIASKEWGKPILKEFLNGTQPDKKTKKEAVKQSILTDADNDLSIDFDFNGKNENELDPENELDSEDPNYIEKSEAERRISIARAERLELQLNIEKGLFVSKSSITPIIYGYGREIRTLLESLPNRVIDPVLASDTRTEAKRILDEEIYTVLNKIADIINE